MTRIHRRETRKFASAGKFKPASIFIAKKNFTSLSTSSSAMLYCSNGWCEGFFLIRFKYSLLLSPPRPPLLRLSNSIKYSLSLISSLGGDPPDPPDPPLLRLRNGVKVSLKPLKVKTVEHFLEVHRLWQFFRQWSDNRCMFY